MSRFFLFGVANDSANSSFSLSTSFSLIHSLENLICRFKELSGEEFLCGFSLCAGLHLRLRKCFKMCCTSTLKLSL